MQPEDQRASRKEQIKRNLDMVDPTALLAATRLVAPLGRRGERLTMASRARLPSPIGKATSAIVPDRQRETPGALRPSISAYLRDYLVRPTVGLSSQHTRKVP